MDYLLKMRLNIYRPLTKLVNDSRYIEQIKKEISDNKSKLFEQKDSITDWENFLCESKK